VDGLSGVEPGGKGPGRGALRGVFFFDTREDLKPIILLASTGYSQVI
jgi:hypothetical protein